MPVTIHGKEYKTVAERVNEFRKDHQEHSIITEIIQSDDIVVMKASIYNGERLIATGHAEEIRGATQINKTSALENCETSAIGRALAAFGLGGTEFASANEVENAIAQQGDEIHDPTHRFKKGEKEEIIKQVREAIFNGEVSHLAEIWHEQPRAAHLKLWTEFESGERAAIKKMLKEADNESTQSD